MSAVVETMLDNPETGEMNKEGEEVVVVEEEEEEEGKGPLVIDPNHPMMERFQRALKKHLEKMRDRVSEDVFQMNNDLRTKEKEKESVGVELYTMQQELFKQQTTLQRCESTLEDLMKERENLEQVIKDKRSHWKEEVERVNNGRKKEQEMLNELNKLSSLERQIEKWESEMDSNLAISQRISEKTQAEKNKMIEEKRKMDMYMLRLMTEVTKFESEIKFMDAELEIKWEEKSVIHQTLSDANADLQALIDEQKRLFAAWNGVISTMSQRDIVYSNISKELLSYQEAFKTMNTEVDSYKKSAAEAMKKNEQLAVIHGRIANDIENTVSGMNTIMEKKVKLENNIALLAATAEETEKDIQIIKMEIKHAEVELYSKSGVYNKLHVERQNIEDKILTLLQDQMANDKTSIHLNKIVRERRNRLRELELVVIEKENKISKHFIEVEEMKGIVARNNEIIDQMKEELEKRDRELKSAENELGKAEMALMQKQGNYATIVKKIERQMEKMGTSKPGQVPLQLRIVELEKLNAEIQEKNDKMQSFWLTQQNNNVKLINQRQEQVKDLHQLRKQTNVLEQKRYRTELEVEKEENFEAQLNKSINSLMKKLVSLNEKMAGKKNYRKTLSRENLLMQTNFMHTLKDAEKEQIRLKNEIIDLENSLEDLAESMLSTQKEMLTWERKIQMAVETRDSIQREKSESGDIGQMKMEIHRMEIRYDQLKKVQEKLITDLELCVLRRDNIAEVAEAKEKRQGKTYNVRTMSDKLDGIRNRIKNLQNEQNNVQKFIKRTEKGIETLREQIQDKEEQLKEMDDKTKKFDRQLEDAKLSKQQNLEMLVRRQKKCKLYNQVKMGKHRLLHRNEMDIDGEMQSEQTINASLVTVTEAMLKDFPAHRFSLMRILNTVSAKSS